MGSHQALPPLQGMLILSPSSRKCPSASFPSPSDQTQRECNQSNFGVVVVHVCVHVCMCVHVCACVCMCVAPPPITSHVHPSPLPPFPPPICTLCQRCVAAAVALPRAAHCTATPAHGQHVMARGEGGVCARVHVCVCACVHVCVCACVNAPREPHVPHFERLSPLACSHTHTHTH